ncbi:glycosyltransferase family 2 protein [uncultured Limosilactobacillus sp.]|uniref:glycosyltransferase family 2 protein n=1 Tax=uncultured Limosilactobacillus sp. TaxID=2837629 RepID=UPI002600BC75|nr:glycosyltransferase family 2 protein [uncultured Limosilactobacillus sp.]
MNKISVIIPVYNAGKYLQQSIDSVLSQTHYDLELILVDDGSTDESVAVCEMARQKDRRVKVLTLPHSGEAQALNTGLAAASGDLLFFMSALDWLGANDNLERLLGYLQDESADVALANFFEFNNQNGQTLIHTLDGSQHVYTPQKWFELEYQTAEFMNQCFTNLNGKLFKRNLLQMADFTNEVNNVHDANTWKFYLLADKIVYINDSMYVVRQNVTDSQSYQFDPSRQNALASIEERIAILTIINFDVNAELAEYLRRLEYHREHDLADGDYYGYLNAVNKLEIIDKNTLQE